MPSKHRAGARRPRTRLGAALTAAITTFRAPDLDDTFALAAAVQAHPAGRRFTDSPTDRLAPVVPLRRVGTTR